MSANFEFSGFLRGVLIEESEFGRFFHLMLEE